MYTQVPPEWKFLKKIPKEVVSFITSLSVPFQTTPELNVTTPVLPLKPNPHPLSLANLLVYTRRSFNLLGNPDPVFPNSNTCTKLSAR